MLGNRRVLKSIHGTLQQASPNIRNLSPKVALPQMVTALRARPFVDCLCKKAIANMVELRIKAAKYMRMEELKDFKNKNKVEDNAVEKKHDKEQPFRGPLR